MNASLMSLDVTVLGAYLEARIDGFVGLQSAEKFKDGQSNPTYLLSAKSGQYVLRRKPPGKLLKSAHAVDREYRIMRALGGTDVPVPHMYHLCEDDSVIGAAFFVMSYNSGRIFWDPALEDLKAAERGEVYHDIIRVMANLHMVDPAQVGLSDFGKPGNYFARQLERWSGQYRASQTGVIEDMETLLTWLPANMPPDDGAACLIHGDFRLDNIIFDPTKPAVFAMLDWELSTLGHPLSDLAYFCMCLRMPRTGIIPGLEGLDRRAAGIPREEELIISYLKARGLYAIDNWPFYLIFSFFRLAAICQGVYKRALDGNASSQKAAEVGALVQPLARMAVRLIS